MKFAGTSWTVFIKVTACVSSGVNKPIPWTNMKLNEYAPVIYSDGLSPGSIV